MKRHFSQNNNNLEKTFHHICHFQLDIFGLSQGLGLRPKLFCHAQNLGLFGTLQNRGDRLRIILEGPKHSLISFLDTYRSILPAAAQFEKEEIVWSDPCGMEKLEIIASVEGESSSPSIPTDLSTCFECWQEYRAPAGVRWQYPFLSCTLCGPRYSVFLQSPYDRERTTFRDYPLCSFCRSEYEDHTNRRFHAQTVVCPSCGPRAVFTTAQGAELAYANYADLGQSVADKLQAGALLAFQSIGGFALVCDANNAEAISALRERKRRPHQPLAVMGKNLQELLKWVQLSPESQENLHSQVAPIVIAPCHLPLPVTHNNLNPDSGTLGVMLPSNPFQSLLFGGPDSTLSHIVYTSGNRHGEPLAHKPTEAFQSLAGIADYFLFCDRAIARPIDDTVIRQSESGNRPWRLARGMAPFKSHIPQITSKNILALGADLKNTFSIGHGHSIWTSPHQGDLENLKALNNFKKNTLDFLQYLAVTPDLIVVDRHSGYASHQWGAQLARERNLTLIEIAHHRAHARATAHFANWEECLNLVYDGTGLGDDGTLWGGELFAWGKTKIMLHVGGFRPMILPGGEQAIWHPARILLGYLKQQGLDWRDFPSIFMSEDLHQTDCLFSNCDKGINSPQCSSVGRLFDLVAVILGAHSGKINHKISYEAQAAIRLESLATKATRPPRGFSFTKEIMGEKIILDPKPMIEELLSKTKDNNDRCQDLALDFHFTIVQMALQQCLWGRERTGLNRVTLSGGVFCNEILVQLIHQIFPAHGLEIFIPKSYSVGDGSISLGQTLLAMESDHA